MLIGDKIKKLRTDKKITRHKLADEINVSRSAIAKWENGLEFPSKDNLASLCEYFDIDRDYFNEPVTPEDLQKLAKKNNTIRKHKWVTKLITGFIVVILVSACLFSTFDINFFTIGIKNEYVARVDCIDGFYVAVYETCLTYTKDGHTHLGNYKGDPDDIIWQHNEMRNINVYSRFLCFSKRDQNAEEFYYLLSEDGTIQYGAMTVLRARSGKIHYYYHRFGNYPDAVYFDGIINEEIHFSCEGTPIELNHYCSFSSDYDFTSGEHTLFIEGEPCRFENILDRLK